MSGSMVLIKKTLIKKMLSTKINVAAFISLFLGLQLLLVATVRADVLLPLQADYSQLEFAGLAREPVLVDPNSAQILKTNHGNVPVFAYTLPQFTGELDLLINSLAVAESLYAASVTLLNAQYQPIYFRSAESGLHVCDRRVFHELAALPEARYLVIAPTPREYPQKQGELCVRWLLGSLPLPIPWYTSVKMIDSPAEDLTVSALKPWHERSRFFWAMEYETAGDVLNGSGTAEQSVLAESYGLLMGYDHPLNASWFIRGQAGFRLGVLQDKNHFGGIAQLGVGHWLNDQWQVNTGVRLDAFRSHTAAGGDYTGPSSIHYKPAVGLHLGTEYRFNRRWHAQVAANIEEMETEDGVYVPAYSAKFSLHYYFMFGVRRI